MAEELQDDDDEDLRQLMVSEPKSRLATVSDELELPKAVFFIRSRVIITTLVELKELE